MATILERMEDRAWNKDADQKGQLNDRKKTSHNQFKFFTSNHSHSESFECQNLHSLFLGT